MTGLAEWRWHCEPARWEFTSPGLRLWPDANTDFWQRTHYGFQADNGHFFHTEAPAAFTLTAHILTRPVHQYDQAGLMVRLSPECWLKTSVEHEPEGASWLGAVVTNEGYSDWSTQPVTGHSQSYHLRIRGDGGCYIVSWSPDGAVWTQLRVATLRQSGTPVRCGVYACCPKDSGLAAEFQNIQLQP